MLTLLAMFAYIFLATLTQYNLARVILADVFMLSVLLPMALYRGLRFDREDFFLIAMFLILFLSTYFGPSFTEYGLIEFSAILFAAFGYFVIKSILIGTPGVSVGSLVQIFLFAAFLSATIGLADLLLFNEALAGMSRGVVVGTFRNQGQSGTFYAIALTVIVPAIAAKAIKPTLLNKLMIAVIFIALMLTFRRSATLAFIMGAIAFLFFSGSGLSVKKILAFVIAAGGATWAISTAISYSEHTLSRFNQKYVSLPGSDIGEGFLANNLSSGMQAFYDNPLFGAGIGNIIGTYTEQFEIHNGYIWLLSQGGLIGLGLFVLWAGALSMKSLKVRAHALRNRITEPTHMFVVYLVPFLITLVLLTGYARIFRLREFWYVAAIASVALYLVQRSDLKFIGHRQAR